MFPARFLILQETLVKLRSTLFLCLAALITASCGSQPASAVSGRTYEFQLADRSDFTVGSGSKSSYFQVNLTKAGVAEGSGSTAFAVDQDLQPATRFYWRARYTQGSSTPDWSATGTFR